MASCATDKREFPNIPCKVYKKVALGKHWYWTCAEYFSPPTNKIKE